MLDWKTLHKTIDGVERILLSTHENPDGDGLGSAYSMYHFLKNKGKDCRIIQISQLPYEYEFLNTDQVIETYNPETHDDWISQVDLALIFDVGDYRRMRQIGDELASNKIHVVNIDHHPDLSDGRFAENFINMDAAATGEMVYDFMKAGNISMTKEIAVGIYTGIVTDTGSFSYSNTNQKCHQIAMECIEVGVNTSQIYQSVYENSSKGRVALLGLILNQIEYNDTGELAWFTIDQSMMNKANATQADVDGFTDFVRKIRGVEVAVMIVEKDNNSCRVNFRSKGKYVINGIAKALGGGGHKLAAGAVTQGSLDEVLPKVLASTRASLADQNGELK
ncbi:MAG: bifunctional oligoribonuclease/PAP phosphatase NrnA [Candidatus Marinimicrobia bacterium]|nr:bifunctional oligoribonuclease/PAP phosphatase NrnA [Candidatus Neomarinimicrobiota bacterium]MBL7009991.1 bifunctional oligoribonuclease/PAP phosphatase NrnA [Candidatus Neomarinimicrobiota bacterium]MBL7029701.1 bifunctional oligoribonuclease/PAP phosphatase NrnA [Candidatus Neomarinimicrobiota bacterium]